ncbi:MAG: NAD(P)H-dependent oxidoreductase subunit E [Chloroflexaceae bacterium]|nr:NAD(P)H-dependent oxidoreductase subunit E [Chloroflexaceae bacterium]
MLREKYASEIDTLRSRFAHRRSAVLPMLYLAQDEYGSLGEEVVREVADVLDLPPTDIFEVVGFYTLFYDRPVGTWMIQVCDDAPCCYCGAEEVMAALKEQLGICENETTEDGMFTIQRVKCLAACGNAPAIQVNLAYLYDVTPEKIDGMLRDLRSRAERGETFRLSGRDADDYTLAPDGSLQRIERRLGKTPEPQPSAA